MLADLPRRPSRFVALVEEMQLMFDSFHLSIEKRWPSRRPTMDLLEDAVDAHPDANTCGGGLDVEVAGASLGGLVEEGVDGLEGRGVGGDLIALCSLNGGKAMDRLGGQFGLDRLALIDEVEFEAADVYYIAGIELMAGYGLAVDQGAVDRAEVGNGPLAGVVAGEFGVNAADAVGIEDEPTSLGPSDTKAFAREGQGMGLVLKVSIPEVRHRRLLRNRGGEILPYNRPKVKRAEAKAARQK